MSNREAALKNAINRTTSFHDIEINAVDEYKSLLVLNPHSYFKVIIYGESGEDKLSAVLDILDGEIFTINFKSDINIEGDEEGKFICFKTQVSNGNHILFIEGINKISTLTVEYFDYFNLTLKEPATGTPITEEFKCCGNQIYHLKPVSASSLKIRNGLFVPSLKVKDSVINIQKIKMGNWEFSFNGDEISTTITYENEATS